ncbi:MAG: Mut7-C RNAse domain-containing protein [Nitrospiraceae bacterium]|nr:Mut7-C RNAse domain-containing protein [Nitrospiraceae bacterium]
MKFIADAMLGRLARWLRLLGHDTYFERDITDDAVLLIAKREGRTVLTRDTRLIQRRAARGQALLIISNDPVVQLKQVVEHFSIGALDMPRCSLCNGLLDRVPDKESLRDLVPEYVFLHHGKQDFFRCSGCGHLYWEGSHIEGIRSKTG